MGQWRFLVTLFLAIGPIAAQAQTLQDFFDAYYNGTASSSTSPEKLIGRDFSSQEMLAVSKIYPRSGLGIENKQESFGVSVSAANSKALILLETVSRKNVHHIVDVECLALGTGTDIYVSQILIQSKYNKKGAVESPSEIGLLVCKAGVPVPTDKRIVPTYIITVGPDAKLQIRKPSDDSKFIFVQGGYI